MQWPLWICVTALVMPILAGERMTVSVCSRGRLGQKTVIGAEAVAATLFRAAEIEIVWAECESGLEGDAATQQHWFTLRFRDGQPFLTPEMSAIDALGEAYLSPDGTGYIADVYYEALQSIADSKRFDLPVLLGYVAAHELGHLLLGPGHAAQGVMRGAWDFQDLRAMGQRGLRFGPEEGMRMRQVLHGP